MKALCSVLLVGLFLGVFGQACVQPGCKSCGNGKCEIGETSCTCPQDCRGCCPDGVCRLDHGETHLNCQDCALSVKVSVVEAQTGAVLSGAMVTCYTEGTFLGPVMSTLSQTTFPRQKEGHWTCKAEKAGYFPNSVSLYLSPAAKCVDVPVIVVPLTFDTCCIFGLVLNAQTGDCINNARVNCTSASGLQLSNIVSDPSGNWFREVRDGVWTCTASATGFRSVTSTKTYLPGEKSTWRFLLPPIPGTVFGRVIDSKNSSVVCNAALSSIVCTDATGQQYSAIGDNFTFTNVAPGAVTCTASKELYITQTQIRDLPSGGRIEIVFPLVEMNGNLEGYIIDGRTGLPISNVDVDCMSSYDMGMTLTNAAGYYFLGGLKKGPFMCMALHKGYSDGWLNQVVDIGQTNVLNFTLLPKEAVLHGRVHLYDLVPGAPVAGASISCWTNDYRGNRYQITNTSDSNGNYRLGDLYGFGEAQCMFTAAGYQPSSRTLKYSWEERIECNIPMQKV